MGWMMGLEPTNAGTTNQCVNHFATPTIRISLVGAPGEIRTPDNLLRRQMLYPTELQAHVLAFWIPIIGMVSSYFASIP